MFKTQAQRLGAFVAMAMIAFLAFFLHAPPGKDIRPGLIGIDTMSTASYNHDAIGATKSTAAVALAAVQHDQAERLRPSDELDRLMNVNSTTDYLGLIAAGAPALDYRLRTSTKSELHMYNVDYINSEHGRGAGGYLGGRSPTGSHLDTDLT